MMEEGNLHKWFRGSKSKDGKPGWVNVVTGGTCASDEPGEGTPKCVSSSKRASMTKAERLSASRRKKKDDPGQQQKSGAAKPTYVSTDKPKKKMNEAKDIKGKGSGKKDACYHKVKSRYSVWPSAYASGALVKCRKKGAANWGNKSEENLSPLSKKVLSELNLDEKCWVGYTQKGMKKKGNKVVPNCVPVKEECGCEKCEKNPCECKKPRGGDGGKPGADKNYVKPMGSVDEAVRMPAKTGNLLMVTLTWKGRYYGIKMFFPQAKVPSRKDVQDQVEKVYPGSRVQSYQISEYKPGETFLQTEGAAWTRKEGQNKEGGLNEKGRKSYERENPGSDLKAPSKKPGNKRRASFCARMKGMKKKLTSTKTASDPDSRINKSLRAWNC